MNRPPHNHRVRRFRTSLLVTCLGLTNLIPVFATAENATARADNREIEEILVISTKRAKADEAQDVPISSTVVNASIISQNNWTDLVDVARMVPGADFRQTATFPGIQRFWMRGVGVSGCRSAYQTSILPSVSTRMGCS